MCIFFMFLYDIWLIMVLCFWQFVHFFLSQSWTNCLIIFDISFRANHSNSFLKLYNWMVLFHLHWDKSVGLQSCTHNSQWVGVNLHAFTDDIMTNHKNMCQIVKSCLNYFHSLLRSGDKIKSLYRRLFVIIIQRIKVVVMCKNQVKKTLR